MKWGVRGVLTASLVLLLACQLTIPLDCSFQPTHAIPGPRTLPFRSPPSLTASTIATGSPTDATVLPVVSELSDLVIDQNRPRAYVADRTNDRILVVDLQTETILRTIPVRSGPVALAINPSGDTLYVGHAGNMSIAAIDLASLTVVRVLNTPFLTWGLVAPTNSSLVATTHDDQWTGQYPYVLNATTGAIIQRLCSGLFCNMFYQDTLVATNSNGTELVLAESALTNPVFLASYRRSPGSDAWTQLNDSRGNGWWQTGGEARDLVVSPDGRSVLLATNMSDVIQLDVASLAYIRILGNSAHSYSAAASLGGSPVAVSVAANSITPQFTLEARDPTGRTIGQYPIPGPIKRVRLTPDGLRFVATVGTNAQDILFLASTAISPQGDPPGDRTNTAYPLISAQIAVFASPGTVNVTLAVDGSSAISQSVNLSTGWVLGLPPSALAEGNHTLLTRVFVNGTEVASRYRDFWVDFAPPVIRLDPYPNTTNQPTVTLNGTVTDANRGPAVNVSGRWVLVDANGRFSAPVDLVAGNNSILIFTYDKAGNYGSVTARIEFRPPETWFVHPTSHFRIRVPYLWSVEGNVTSTGGKVDLAITAPAGAAAIVVVSENRTLQGTWEEARSLLQEGLSNLSNLPGFQILKGPTDHAVGGLPAVWATVTWQPSTYNVDEVIIVVVSGEWHMFWALAGSTFTWAVGTYFPVINETISSFTVLPKESTQPSGPAAILQTLRPWILYTGLAATVAEGLIFAGLILRGRRKRA